MVPLIQRKQKKTRYLRYSEEVELVWGIVCSYLYVLFSIYSKDTSFSGFASYFSKANSRN